MNNDVDFKEIAKYIIKVVQENSDSTMSGYEYMIDYSDIEKAFNLKMNDENKSEILKALNQREEIADIEDVREESYLDIVLYTDYAPNYIEEVAWRI